MQRLPGRCARVAGEMCKGCRGDVATWENKVNSFSIQLKVELGLQFREEFDNKKHFQAKKQLFGTNIIILG